MALQLNMPQMPLMGYQYQGAQPLANPYFQYQIPQGGFNDPTSARIYGDMYGSATNAGASRDVAAMNAMASVINNQTNAQAGYDTAYGQAKYGRANLLDQLSQQSQLAQMQNELNRYQVDKTLEGNLGVANIGAGAQRYGADQQLAGQLGVAGIGADANRYATDASRQVALANQQNQLALAQLANSGNLDVANAQNEAVRARQERFNQILPIFQSLFGFTPSASTSSAALPNPAAPPTTQVASAPAAPTAPAAPSTPPAPSAPSMPAAPSMPSMPPVPQMGTGTSSYASAMPPIPQMAPPTSTNSASSGYSSPVTGQSSVYSPDWQGRQGGLAMMASNPQQYDPRFMASQKRPPVRHGRGVMTASAAQPSQPQRPSWLLGNYPQIG